MTKENYSIAFSEMIYIINNMNKANRDKISKEFINFLNKNKDINYIPKDISLEDKESLRRETKILIAIMHRDYFMEESEKARKEREEKEILEEMYSYDNLFKTQKVKETKKESLEIEEIVLGETDLIKVEEKNCFFKIKTIIQNFFNRFKK